MTEPIYGESAPPIQEAAVGIEDDLDGLGPTKLYYFDLQPMALEPSPSPKPTLIRRLRTTTSVVSRAVPKMLGQQQARSAADAADA
jgi:hypothetical protein